MIVANVRFKDPMDGQRIAKGAGTSFNPLSDVVIASVDNQGNLKGGSLFRDYTGRGGSAAIHVASFTPRWMTHDLLWVTFDYAFNQMGVKKLWGQVHASKQDVLKFDLKLGFRPELIVKDVYPDGDMVLLSMYREHCRFLEWQPRRIGSTGHGR